MDSSSDHVGVKGTNDGEFLEPEGINLPFRKLCVCISYIRKQHQRIFRHYQSKDPLRGNLL
jgi:hypothetical protein